MNSGDSRVITVIQGGVPPLCYRALCFEDVRGKSLSFHRQWQNTPQKRLKEGQNSFQFLAWGSNPSGQEDQGGWTGEMARRLGALPVLAEEHTPIPSTHMVIHKSPETPVKGDLMSSSGLLLESGTHVVHLHTHRQSTHIHEIKIDNFSFVKKKGLALRLALAVAAEIWGSWANRVCSVKAERWILIFRLCSLKKYLFYLFLVRWACMSLCVGVCICGSGDNGVQKRLFDTLELEWRTYRWFRTAWYGCWELNQDLLQEQDICTQPRSHLSLQPVPFYSVQHTSPWNGAAHIQCGSSRLSSSSLETSL